MPIHRKKFTTFLIALVILGSVLYLAGLAIGPRVSQASIDQDSLWLQNIYLSPPFGISLNKDSYLYLLSARNTKIVFGHEAVLQSRPLLSLIAHPLSRVLQMMPMVSLPGASALFNHLLPTYLVFVFINLAMLIGCYRLYASMVLPRRQTTLEWSFGISVAPCAFVIGTLLIVNEITKAFFFAAHTQMFNLLVPMLALWVLLYLRAANIRYQTYVLSALLAGLGTLAYGAVMVIGAAIVLARMHSYRSAKSTGVWSMMAELLLLLAMLILPYFAWWLTVTLINGEFFNHDVKVWKHVVWMSSVFDNGLLWLLSSLASNLAFFLAATLHHLVTSIPLVVLLILFSWPHRVALKRAFNADISIVIAAAVIAIVFLVFFSLVGYRVTRLAMPVAVMAIVLYGVWAAHLEALLAERQRQQLLSAVGAVMVINTVWTAAKEGPFY
jgi:hypothetical protein